VLQEVLDQQWDVLAAFTAGLAATSKAPDKRQSSDWLMASINIWPMRPEAPATATACKGVPCENAETDVI
jgi:hypothetical protein